MFNVEPKRRENVKLNNVKIMAVNPDFKISFEFIILVCKFIFRLIMGFYTINIQNNFEIPINIIPNELARLKYNKMVGFEMKPDNLLPVSAINV